MWVNIPVSPPIPLTFDPSAPPSESRNPGATSMVKARTFGRGFSAPARGAIDKVLPPWMTLYYTLLCCKRFVCFFRNVTQEEHSYIPYKKGCRFQTGKLNKTHKSYCTQHQQSFPHSHVAENRQESSTTRHIFPHVPEILAVQKKKQHKPRRSNLWYSNRNCQTNYTPDFWTVMSR